MKSSRQKILSLLVAFVIMCLALIFPVTSNASPNPQPLSAENSALTARGIQQFSGSNGGKPNGAIGLAVSTSTKTPTKVKTATSTKAPTNTKPPTITKTATRTKVPTKTKTATSTKVPTKTKTSTPTKPATASPTLTLVPTVSPNQLFGDDFNDLNLEGWTVEESGLWSASLADLRPEFGCPADMQNFLISVGDTTWTNYEINFDVNPLTGKTAFLLELRRSITNPNITLTFVLHSQNNLSNPYVEIGRTDFGRSNFAPILVSKGQWSSFSVKMLENRIKVFQVTNGQNSLLIDNSDAGLAAPSGGIAFSPQSYDLCNAMIAFDNIRIRKIDSFASGN